MSDRPLTKAEKRTRRRWITLAEIIAVAALLISGLGLWLDWNKKDEKPALVVEQQRAVRLALRGKPQNDGRALEISPVEGGHALESLSIRLPGTESPVDAGSDGILVAEEVEAALGRDTERTGDRQRVRVQIDARYVEAGHDRRATGSYDLTYRWEGGGLFGGRSLRLVSLSR